jgi:hypothetical protein
MNSPYVSKLRNRTKNPILTVACSLPEPVASDISSDDFELREELYYDENEMNLNLDANDFETQSERTELVVTKTNKEQRVYVYVGLRWDVLYRQAFDCSQLSLYQYGIALQEY